MNTKIYLAPSRRKSSEALAAEQMSFKFFSANVSVDSEEVRRTTGRLFHCWISYWLQTCRQYDSFRTTWFISNTNILNRMILHREGTAGSDV